jgi:hypothetical protein
MKDNLDLQQQYREWVAMWETTDSVRTEEDTVREGGASTWDDSLFSSLVSCDQLEFPLTRGVSSHSRRPGRSLPRAGITASAR